MIVNLIGNTTTDRGFASRPNWTRSLPDGIKVTDEQLAAVIMTPDAFHGEWNYTIRPRRRKKVGNLF